MRDIALVSAIFVALTITLFNPFAGVILWTWFTVQNPHEEAYSFSRGLPLNLIIAIVTILAWLSSRERKLPPGQFLVWAMVVFVGWTTFNSFFAVDPNWSWQFWDRTWKTFALGLLIATLATNPVRIHAIIWTIVLSLFYFGVKGGIFTINSGGHYEVLGPDNTMIADNNQLAVALLMTVPLANYLRRQSANVSVRWALAAGMLLTLVSVIGSYSRGAFLGLGALGAVGLLRSRRRIVYLVTAGVFGYAILHFMPQSFWDRMDTIQTAGDDPSFQGREVAWQVAYDYARDHFPFGAGFYGPQLDAVFHYYFPKAESHAAHSIFFQVLGEHGFIGLAIYVAILVGALLKCSRIIGLCRDRPDLEWARDLATMLQMSLFVFCVAGAALSLAYYDVFVICVSLLVPLSVLCTRQPPTSPDLQPESSRVQSPPAVVLPVEPG